MNRTRYRSKLCKLSFTFLGVIAIIFVYVSAEEPVTTLKYVEFIQFVDFFGESSTDNVCTFELFPTYSFPSFSLF